MKVVRTNKVLRITSVDLWAGDNLNLFTLMSSRHKKEMISVSVALFNHGTLKQ